MTISDNHELKIAFGKKKLLKVCFQFKIPLSLSHIQHRLTVAAVVVVDVWMLVLGHLSFACCRWHVEIFLRGFFVSNNHIKKKMMSFLYSVKNIIRSLFPNSIPQNIKNSC